MHNSIPLIVAVVLSAVSGQASERAKLKPF